MNMIMGLRKQDSGSVQVLGLDPIANGRQLKQRIGIQLQEAELPARIKVWEALKMFSSFYEHVVPWEGLMEEWGLTDKRNTAFGRLSGGQKQRVFIALALLNDPEVVFLDELTTGLDPQARRQTWELIRAIRDRGKTVIQVTHFMDEAEELCDRVAVIDQKRVIALDTPQGLIAQMHVENSVRFTGNGRFQPSMLDSLANVNRIIQDEDAVTVYGTGPLLANVAAKLAEHGLSPNDIHANQISLEDVYLSLTDSKQ
jgi:ABC-2 type transport system ATP-binding protein